jgi:hypothetical protein
LVEDGTNISFRTGQIFITFSRELRRRARMWGMSTAGRAYGVMCLPVRWRRDWAVAALPAGVGVGDGEAEGLELGEGGGAQKN